MTRADPTNNVESVFLPAGVSGPFTVTVRAANIAGDGVPGNADTTDQDFALVIYNTLDHPRSVAATLLLPKSTAPPGRLILSWSATCMQARTDYGIYEGTIGNWYSHARIDDCTDDGGNLTETVTPAAGNKYYLVVPHSSVEEGSYGTSSAGAERPVGTAACVTPQVVTPCSP